MKKRRTMENDHSDIPKRKPFHVVCFLFGHDFDPINACSNEDEHCQRCGKKCEEHDRWFDWNSYIRWRLLPVRRVVQKVKGKKDIYSF
ncbi:DUF1660 family phage protein [Prolixibacter sp. NT017]|uniref:DUF1660 family phage protein n=1 Tax=Prolixibacter sp. NT017 TaxID=2652390 RepID=UPI001298FAD4|nr:DUF1660 family phage protein [Prolixibacter sp. NT017]